MLNVGPDADGFIPQQSQDILRKVGAWLKVNGEAIYGAGPTPFGDELGEPVSEKTDRRGRPMYNLKKEWRCTTKDNRLYIHIFKWPDKTFKLTGIKQKVKKAYLLIDCQKELQFTQTDDTLTVNLPKIPPQDLATVLCLETE